MPHNQLVIWCEIKSLAIRGVPYYGKYLDDKSVVRPLSVLDIRCSFPCSSSFGSLPALGAYLPRGRLTYRFPLARVSGRSPDRRRSEGIQVAAAIPFS